MSPRVSDHIDDASPTAAILLAAKGGLHSSLAEKLLSLLSGNERADLAKVNARRRSKGLSISGPHQRHNVEPLPEGEASLNSPHSSECCEGNANRPCSISDERNVERMEITAGFNVASESQRAAVCRAKGMSLYPKTIDVHIPKAFDNTSTEAGTAENLRVNYKREIEELVMGATVV
jgi:hypothetical protein